jgi:DNA-binding NarL/FixJ family response regulator
MHTLTTTQRTVLSLISRGCTNAEIAGALGIAEKTVKVHTSAILKTLDAPNRTTAALKYHGLPVGLPS